MPTLIIAENEEGTYQPLNVAGSLSEAREMVDDHRKFCMQELEKGKTPMCVYSYKIWNVGIDGSYKLAEEIAS